MRRMENKRVNFVQAINDGIMEEMEKDSSIILYGQNMALTDDDPFVKKFGKDRVRFTPISETAEAGMAIGASMTGLKVIVDLVMTDFMLVAMEQLLNQAPRMRFSTGGQVKLNVVFKAGFGFIYGWSTTHSNTWYELFMRAFGSKLVIPSTPYDAKGLIKSAIHDGNPVFYLTPFNLYAMEEDIPVKEYYIPLGKADIKREGNDVTVIAIGWMIQKALGVADKLAKEGISVEVIDPRTLIPLDKKTIFSSLEKTGRLVIVDQAPKTGSAASEISAVVAEEAFHLLKAPIKRVCSLDTSVAYSKPLEEYTIPDEMKIIKAIQEVLHV
ncbi:TPP-dependent acetoin dehydrogenase complex, E1 protein subunit beta [Sulfolobus acidocaldarius SUSAZ]|nr:TPP-dependent acetoin dehydrogenase complex, E1 protein subunit beta [Sulfolobus acidocaldarius SUSAZ]